jgi:hypothetical protein
MSLPPAQERVLDAMAEALRTSEPRLVSMFAMFGRLAKNEAAPSREQLPRGRRLAARLRRGTAKTAPQQGQQPRRIWLHVLVASPIAIALTVIGLVAGLSSHSAAPPCPLFGSVRVTVSHHVRKEGCPVQADSPSGGQLLGK